MAAFTVSAGPTIADEAEEQLALAGPPEVDAEDPAELDCLAKNIYFEARGEPLEGQLAVAHVTLNRTRSDDFPESICEVVKEGSSRGCQFSWHCDGLPDEVRDQVAWERALLVARAALRGLAPDPTDGALYFHVKTLNPKWSRDRQLRQVIGGHVFIR